MRHFILVCLCCFSAVAFADEPLPAFNAIRTEGAFNVQVTMGSAPSVQLKGDASVGKRISVNVVDGELQVKGTEHVHVIGVDDQVIITLPALRQFKGKGVGEVQLKNIDGERIDIAFEGVGRLEAAGKIKWLRIKGNGVGEINTKKLLAEDADVDFDGVGGVDLYASNHLNAVVHGVGSVTYYGNPKVVNKSANGIGSITAGK